MYRTAFFLLLLPLLAFPREITGIVSGQVIDQKTGTPLPLCNISVSPGNVGTITDTLGLYVLSLSYGVYQLEFSYTGYESVKKTVKLNASTPRIRLNIALTPLIYPGEEITVIGKADLPPPDVQIIEQVDIKRIPTIYSDVLRSVKILPGVTSNNELSSSYNVRGGNFDENLIYLNGYEIYRPYLLRTGIEENHSLINRYMVRSIEFYNGGYPVEFGDKMSSVLVVEYEREHSERLQGLVWGGLLNSGLTLKRQVGKLSWGLGARYANPRLFLKKLQTSGDYRPQFADVQAQISYQLSSHNSLDCFLLYANNRFNLRPENWMGNFKFSLYDVRSINIEYQGHRNYSFITNLLGIRYRWNATSTTRLSVSLAGYHSRESEDMDLSEAVYYVPDARYPNSNKEYLKTRFEQADNRLEISSYQAKVEAVTLKGAHRWRFGGSLKWNQMSDRINEHFEERGDENLLEPPQSLFRNYETRFPQFDFYVQDIFELSSRLRFNMGVRYLYYQYSKENLLSPRASLHFFPSPSQTIYLRTGIYYQPPFYSELRTQAEDSPKSQKAVHYILGWNTPFKEKLEFQLEFYYKDLKRLRPFYQDQLRIIYTGSNANEGFSAGFDLLIKGELIEGLNSWISYGYGQSKERPVSGEDYQPRLLDQRHTLRFFLQDKIPQHPGIQYHTRILFGSGYLYHPRRVVEDPQTGQRYLSINFQERQRYNFYARVDMGLSARTKLTKTMEVNFVGEVLNVFNNSNIAGYSWFQVFPDSQQPLRIPHVFTRRSFNLGAELSF
ncbi:MAG: carboxypeptidase-like regulatory domain-containing protein [Calditrichia bacterium]